MTALERLKALASVIERNMSWRKAEQWIIMIFLGFELLLMFLNPIASIAMGVFLIAVLIAATSF